MSNISQEIPNTNHLDMIENETAIDRKKRHNRLRKNTERLRN